MSSEIPRDTILTRIANELRDLSVQTALVEDALAGDSARRNQLNRSREIVQELDRVRQTQDCLADCLDAIADLEPFECMVPVATLMNGTPLPSVADRLRTGARHGDVTQDQREPEIW